VATGGLTGILLVGGASRRFGSPKALAELDGETLAARAWRTLAATCDERLAVGKHADGLILPFELLDDGSDVRAPLAGLVAGLRAASHELSVVLPVDVPLIHPEHLRELADNCLDVAVPQTGPLPGAYRKSALPVLEARLARGELAIRDALRQLDMRMVELDPQALVNVNDPSDLQRLTIEIAPFEAKHGEGFAALVADTLREFGFERDPEFDRDLDDPAGAYVALWIASSGDEVAGSAALRDLGDGVYELKRMYLRPAHRGRGIGKRLLAIALDWARANGAQVVRLDTTERMVAARRLYESEGFVRVPGEESRQGQQRLLYQLRLRTP
jgi:molybdopterin-guanine dinucleotide biosynthesis protein A/N-acetylglutamate synthase-like GNAT family acetyltransferase